MLRGNPAPRRIAYEANYGLSAKLNRIKPLLLCSSKHCRQRLLQMHNSFCGHG